MAVFFSKFNAQCLQMCIEVCLYFFTVLFNDCVSDSVCATASGGMSEQ